LGTVTADNILIVHKKTKRWDC